MIYKCRVTNKLRLGLTTTQRIHMYFITFLFVAVAAVQTIILDATEASNNEKNGAAHESAAEISGCESGSDPTVHEGVAWEGCDTSNKPESLESNNVVPTH
jgi:hypothetical protein